MLTCHSAGFLCCQKQWEILPRTQASARRCQASSPLEHTASRFPAEQKGKEKMYVRFRPDCHLTISLLWEIPTSPQCEPYPGAWLLQEARDQPQRLPWSQSQIQSLGQSNTMRENSNVVVKLPLKVPGTSPQPHLWSAALLVANLEEP